jgi:predicted dinucleotide-binding enzyme
MEIGIIGLNEISEAFCKHWLKRGHQIFYGDLSLYSAQYVQAEKLGSKVTLVLPEKLVSLSEVIVLAVAHNRLHDAIGSLGEVKQKIIIDLTDEPTGQRMYKSSFEEIKRLLPETKVVRVTNTYPHHLQLKKVDHGKPLYSYSNDNLAQRMVRWFVDGSGYKMIDLQGTAVPAPSNISSIL